MATTTRVLNANVTGTVYNTNLNSTLEALDTSHSGPTAPTDEVVNGKLWLDTSTTPGILRIYNNATWEVVHSGTVDINGGSIDGTTIGGTTPAAGTFTGVGVTGTVTATSFSGDGSALTSLTAGNLTGTLPAIDGSSLTGIDTTPTTGQVLTATAGATVGAVGTYVLAKYAFDTTAAAGSTHAGSNLQPVSLSHISTYTATPNGSALSGTWRAMGYLADWLPVTLFVRIS